MSELKKFITLFLEEQRRLYLDKKIKSDVKDVQRKYESLLSKKSKDGLKSIEDIEKAKNRYDQATEQSRVKHEPEAIERYKLDVWLRKAIEDAKPNITTHPAKFTDSQIKQCSSLVFKGRYFNDGYLRTGNVSTRVGMDVSGNSATNTIIFELFSLLNATVNNKSSLFNFFEQDDCSLQEIIEQSGLDYQIAKHKCLDLLEGKENGLVTSEKLKQVYFPMNGGYHLLSLVTASTVMFELKNRIDDFNVRKNGESVRSIKSRNEYDTEGFDEVLDLTVVGFSHSEFTKMGNVSYLNVRNKGLAYLLSSTPPELIRREIRLPKTDFFKNTLNPRMLSDSFQSLHRLMVLASKDGDGWHGNKKIQQGIDNVIQFVIDAVLGQAFKIRAQGVGWSATEYYQTLPLAQRIWLDDAYVSERAQQDEWLASISRDFAVWILKSYEYSLKKQSIKLSDFEAQHVENEVQIALKNDEEFFK